jgi:CPA2 family monovalent cation:H+ antiporter-2
VITDLAGVRPLAELGVVFLLFMIGLELSLDRLWAMRRRVFGLGGAQVVVTGSVIAVIASYFDNTLAAAVVLGCAFALSSTAIVMQLLSEKRRLGTATGRTSFAILLCQDLAVLPILFLVGALAAQGDAPVPLAFALAIGEAVIAVVAILAIGRLVIRHSSPNRSACRWHWEPSSPGCCSPKLNTGTKSRSTSNRSKACCSVCSSSRLA